MKSFSPLKRLLPIFILLAFSSSQAQNIPKLESIKVLRIIDGDTLMVNYKGKEESVRLIGIDAPESRPNEKAKGDAKRSGEDLKTITATGKEATRFVKTPIKPGDMLRMEFAVQKRDKYGRLLAYVYLPDGTLLNAEIMQYNPGLFR